MSAPVTVSSLLIESVPPSVQYGHGGSTTRVPRAISSSGLPEPAFFALNFASHAASRWPQTLTASCAGDSASVSVRSTDSKYLSKASITFALVSASAAGATRTATRDCAARVTAGWAVATAAAATNTTQKSVLH